MLFRDKKDVYSVAAGMVGWGTILLFSCIITLFLWAW